MIRSQSCFEHTDVRRFCEFEENSDSEQRNDDLSSEDENEEYEIIERSRSISPYRSGIIKVKNTVETRSRSRTRRRGTNSMPLTEKELGELTLNMNIHISFGESDEDTLEIAERKMDKIDLRTYRKL
jgi:hypothetical protein